MKNVLKGSVLQPSGIKLCVELLKLGSVGRFPQPFLPDFIVGCNDCLVELLLFFLLAGRHCVRGLKSAATQNIEQDAAFGGAVIGVVRARENLCVDLVAGVVVVAAAPRRARQRSLLHFEADALGKR